MANSQSQPSICRYGCHVVSVFTGVFLLYLVMSMSTTKLSLFGTEIASSDRVEIDPEPRIDIPTSDIDAEQQTFTMATNQTATYAPSEVQQPATNCNPAADISNAPAEQQEERRCHVDVFMDSISDKRYGHFLPWIKRFTEFLNVTVTAWGIDEMTLAERSERISRWSSHKKSSGRCLLELFYIGSRNAVWTDEIVEFINAAISARRNAKPIKGWKSLKKNQWNHAIHVGSNARGLSMASGRPFLIQDTGEAFKPLQIRNPGAHDLVLSRVHQEFEEGVTGHFIQGINLGYRSYTGDMKHFDVNMHRNWDIGSALQQDFSSEKGQVEYFTDVMKEKTQFAAIMNSRIMKRSLYKLDAVLRFVVCDILNDYKPCHSISKVPNYLQNKDFVGTRCKYPRQYGIRGIPWDQSGYICFEPYKFALSMENTITNGYISEKLFNAKLSHSIPVYLGARDIGKYINRHAIVHCDVREETLMHLRSMADPKHLYQDAMFNKTKQDNVTRCSDVELVKWVRNIVESDLKPCIDEVKYLDQNEAAYLKKLKEPLFHDNFFNYSTLDGSELAGSIALLLRDLEADSRLFEAFDNDIFKLVRRNHIAGATAMKKNP